MTRRFPLSPAAWCGALVVGAVILCAPGATASADTGAEPYGQAESPGEATRSGSDTAVGVLAALGAVGIGGGLVVVARRKRS